GHVDEQRARGEGGAGIPEILADEYGDRPDAAIRRNARAARAAVEREGTDRVEGAIEDHRLVGGEHAAIRLQADAAFVRERDPFARQPRRRTIARGRRLEGCDAQRAVAGVDAGMPEDDVRPGSDPGEPGGRDGRRRRRGRAVRPLDARRHEQRGDDDAGADGAAAYEADAPLPGRVTV